VSYASSPWKIACVPGGPWMLTGLVRPEDLKFPPLGSDRADDHSGMCQNHVTNTPATINAMPIGIA
jgi:hypothetical protein